MDSPADMKGPFRKRKLFAVLILFFVFYCTLSSTVLNLDSIRQRMNKRPDKIEVSYTYGYSLFPCLFSLSGVHLIGKGTSPYEIKADTLSLWLNPFALLQRRISLYFPTVKDSRVTIFSAAYLRKKKQRSNMNNSPVLRTQGPDQGVQSIPDKRSRKRWDIKISAASFQRVQEIRIDDFIFNGEGMIHFSLFREADILAIPKGQFKVLSGEVKHVDTGKLVLRKTALTANFSIAPYEFQAIKGKKVLSNLHGEITLDDVIADDLSFLTTYFKKNRTITLSGGRGTLEGTVRISKGLFQKGSFLKYEGNSIDSHVSDYDIQGGGTVRWRVVLQEGKPIWELLVTLNSYNLSNGNAPYLFGESAFLQLTGHEFSVGQSVREFQANFTLKDGLLPDIACYNTYIPDTADCEILSGKGTLESEIILESTNRLGKGKIKLRAPQSKIRFQDNILQGALQIETFFGHSPLDKMKLNLEPTFLSLTKVIISDEQEVLVEDWWANLSISNGTIVTGTDKKITAEFSLKTRDFWPLFYIYVQSRTNLPDLLTRSISIPLTEGKGKITLGKNFTELRDLHLWGEHLEVDIVFRKMAELKHGAILCTYTGKKGKKHHLALHFDGLKKKYKLKGAADWFSTYKLPSPQIISEGSLEKAA